MVRLIREAAECDIAVGQNGVIWVEGAKIEDELVAKKIIEFICENSYITGLTEKVEQFIEKEFGKKIKMQEPVAQSEGSQEQNVEGEENVQEN